MLCLVLAPIAVATPSPDSPQGVTMQVRQEVDLGDLKSVTEGRQYFLPPQNFRMEGTTLLQVLDMKSKVIAVGNSKQVKMLVETPFGPQATVVDLARVQETVPDYVPASDYDPTAYQRMLAEIPGKKALPGQKLDGVEIKGYEFSVEGMKLSLPSNMQLGLAKPAKVRAWVNPADGILRKLEIENTQGNVFLLMLYTDVKTNVTIPPETFELTFPEGVTPADLTESILERASGGIGVGPDDREKEGIDKRGTE